MYTYWRGTPLQQGRFYSLSYRNIFVGGMCTVPSALLVFFNFGSVSVWFFKKLGFGSECVRFGSV